MTRKAKCQKSTAALLVIGGAYGASTSRASFLARRPNVGLQAGGQAYGEIIFFKDKAALDEFTSGNFEFGAGVSTIAITAGCRCRVRPGRRLE